MAVRIIVDRELEIKAFNPVEYWVLKGRFALTSSPTGTSAILPVRLTASPSRMCS